MFGQNKCYSWPIKDSSKPLIHIQFQTILERKNKYKGINEDSNHSQEGMFLVAPRGGEENLSLDELF